MKLLKITERILFLIGFIFLFINWKTALVIFFVGGLIRTFPFGPHRIFPFVAGGLMIGGVVSLFFSWKIGICFFVATFLITEFYSYGNKKNAEYYEDKQDWKDFIDGSSDNSVESKIIIKMVREFLIPDRIEFKKFLANFKILESGSRESYKVSAELNDEPDYSDLGTYTIDSLVNPIDRPIGYETWFVAAYPDVVKWFANLDDDEATKILGNPKEKDLFDKSRKIRQKYLKRIIRGFKITGGNFECVSHSVDKLGDNLSPFVGFIVDEQGNYELHLINPGGRFFLRVNSLTGAFSSFGEDLLETGRTARERGLLLSHSSILLERGDYRDLDFTIWYHFDLYEHGKSEPWKVRFGTPKYHWNEKKIHLPIIKKDGIWLNFFERDAGAKIIEEEVKTMHMESRYLTYQDGKMVEPD